MAPRVQKNLPPVDPNQHMPSAVRAAADRANEIMRQVREGPAPDPTPVKIAETAPLETRVVVEDASGTVPVTPTPPVQPTNPVPPAANDADNPDLAWKRPPQAAPNPEMTPQPAQKPVETTQIQPQNPPKQRDFERELAASQGRLVKAQEHIRAQDARLQQLEGMVVSLTQSATPRELQAASLITPEEKETWGEDMLKVVEKKVQEVVGQKLEQVGADVTQLKGAFGQVATRQAQTDQERMWQQMDQQLPGWEKLNNDPDFIAWTALPDDASGVIRQQLMQNAFNTGNAKRVLWFFRAYQQETAPGGPAPAPTPTPQPGKVPLERFAAPGRATSQPVVTTASEKPYIKRSQIGRFYADLGAGKFKDNPKEKDRLEKLIFEATAEGRVIDG